MKYVLEIDLNHINTAGEIAAVLHSLAVSMPRIVHPDTDMSKLSDGQIINEARRDEEGDEIMVRAYIADEEFDNVRNVREGVVTDGTGKETGRVSDKENDADVSN